MKTQSILRTTIALALAGAVSSAQAIRLDENEDVTRAGDVLQYAIPITGLFGSIIADDKEGRWQYFKSFLGQVTTVEVVKQIARKARPRGTSRASFPSGHTSSAFSGAAFINTRYGYKWGIPAYAAATFTAYSRVQANAHFLDDVMAGASTALFYNWAFVSPYSNGVGVAPMMFSDGSLGLQLNLAQAGSKGSSSKTYAKSDKKTYPRYRYELAFGPAFMSKNEVTAPRDNGTPFNLFDFDKRDDPTTTSMPTVHVALDPRNELTFFVQPFESKDTGRFSSPVSFSNKTFPADTDLNSDYFKLDFAGQWSYNLMPESRWNPKVGVGLNVQFISVELETQDKTIGAKAEDFSVLPYLLGELGYQVTPKLSAVANVDGIAISSDILFDAGFRFQYQFNDHWDASLGYAYYKRVIDISKIKNDVAYNILAASLAYTF